MITYLQIGVVVRLITVLLGRLIDEYRSTWDNTANIVLQLPCGILALIVCWLVDIVIWPILTIMFVIGSVIDFISKKKES